MVARVQQFHPPVEPCQPLRGRIALRVQRCPECGEWRRLKALPLQQQQDSREQSQLMRRFLHRSRDRPYAATHEMKKIAVDNEGCEKEIAEQSRICPGNVQQPQPAGVECEKSA